MPLNQQVIHARRFYQEGRDAYALGVQSDANPFWYFTKKRQDWQRGFEDAKKEAVAARVKEIDALIEATRFDPAVYYQEGWTAYQNGGSPLSPFRHARNFDGDLVGDDAGKERAWQNGYRDAERAADPDSLVPRMGDITGLASFRSSTYQADINIPRERLFSIEKSETRYTLFTAVFKTRQRESRLVISYIQARNIEEAVGILFVHVGDVLHEAVTNWTVDDCPVQGAIPQLTFGQKGIYVEGT